MATDYVARARAAYDEVGPAWEGRTMRLLSSPHARTYAAMLLAMFPDMTESVPDAALYDVLDQVMAGLAASGVEADWPMSAGERISGREAASRLMGDWGWLERVRSADRPGHFDFRLTLDAMRALSAIKGLAKRDSTANGAVMDMLLDRLRDLYGRVSNDPAGRRAALVADLMQAQERLDEFDAAGGAEADYEDAANRLAAIVMVMDPLIEGEAVLARRLSDQVDSLVGELRDEASVAGEVIRSYYERSNALQYETQDGRDYRGVVEAMSSSAGSEKMGNLVEGIATSRAFAGDGDVRERIEGRWRQVEDGARTIGRILGSASERVTSLTAATAAVTRRELLRSIRAAESALARLDGRSASRPGGFPMPHVSHSRSQAPGGRLPSFGRAQAAPPPALGAASLDGADAAGRRARDGRGGPNRAATAREVLGHAVRAADGRVDVCATFDAIGPGSRRLIDAMSVGTPDEGAPHRTWHVDGRGGEASWEGPALYMTNEELEDAASGR